MIVADPVPEVAVPMSSDVGTESEPVSVPPESVMVNGATAVGPARLVRESVPAKLPFPILVKFAVPVAETPVAVTDAVAFTVNVVFVVSA